jgi:hypothetical protein
MITTPRSRRSVAHSELTVLLYVLGGYCFPQMNKYN